MAGRWRDGKFQAGKPTCRHLYGGTYVPKMALKVAVQAAQTTMLDTSVIPLGGTISGTVTDSTTGNTALDNPPVGIAIPGASKLKLNSSQGWYIVCVDSNGFFNQSTSAQAFTSGDGTLTVNGSVSDGPNYPPPGTSRAAKALGGPAVRR